MKNRTKEIKERIGNAIKTIKSLGIVGIILLFLANITSAGIPLSDGFDYPVGWPDRRQVINIDSCLMVIMTRIFRNNHR